MLFGFGKKRKLVKKNSKNKKPSSRLVKLARKYRVKISIKVGKRRVYKTDKLLMKQIRRKMKKSKKLLKKPRRRVVRFGEAAFLTTYKQLGILDQSSAIANSSNNTNRPKGLGIDKINTQVSKSSLPVYGTYADFFGEKVPKVLPPNWYCNKDRKGNCTPVGWPFYAYRKRL